MLARRFAMDDAKRSLYVNRPLKNAAEVLAWAKAQGFGKTLTADDVHVTIAYSKSPVDWSDAGDSVDDVTVPAASDQRDGSRSVEKLGDEGAIVLRFESPELAARWKEICDVGGSWDYPSYKPHVTITYEGGDVDLSKVDPYSGPLEFGPEHFDEIKPNWHESVQHASDALAFDRATVRTKDKDGRLHIAVSNISKAAVNPYRGEEIPGWQELGLDADRVYKLFRDPEELAKGAATFNNIPLLARHVPVSAADHQPELVIGSTGTDAEFTAPYLRNSLVVWAGGAVDAIEAEEQKELSSAYRYRADMTPGMFAGEAYDGVMRDIVGNHVALVKEGRAGADVVVGDAALQPSERRALTMTAKTVLTRKGAVTMGALAVYLAPKLAQDKQIDLAPILSGLTTKNFKDKKPSIVAALKSGTKDILAKDASIEDVAKLLDTLQEAEVVEGADADPETDLPMTMEQMKDKAADADPGAAVEAFLKGKLSDEDVAKVCAMIKGQATDADPDKDKDKDADKDKDKKDMVSKPAMDAAIAEAAKKATADAIKAQQGIRDAEKAVRPYVGDLAMAHDSADAVYKTALTTLGVKCDGIHPSAFPALLAAQKLPGKNETKTVVAMDAAASDEFAKQYPHAAKIKIN